MNVKIKIASRTRFLFEIDYDEKPRRKLEELKAEVLALMKDLLRKGIANRITFSGNISYHCIIETSYEVPDYKLFWHHMNNKYFGGRADKNCAHPSRWTRTPGMIRSDTEKLQRGYGNVNCVFDPIKELVEMENVLVQEQKMKIQPVPRNRNEAFTKAVEKTRAKIKNPCLISNMKPEAQRLLEGVFPSDGFVEWANIAINCLHGFGYSSDVIWKLLEPAGKDKKGRDRRDKVKGFVFKNRTY